MRVINTPHFGNRFHRIIADDIRIAIADYGRFSRYFLFVIGLYVWYYCRQLGP